MNDQKFLFDKSVQTIPYDVYQTSQRPDIVICNKVLKTITVIEVTVPFETNFLDAQHRKAERYSPLLAGLDEIGYKCFYHSFEFAREGYMPKEPLSL